MIHWKWCPYPELSLNEFHSIIQLRETVFILEQNYLYLDVDGKDPYSWHLMGFQSKPTEPLFSPPPLVAYLRVVKAGYKFKEPSIGRVVTAKSVRNTGIGRALMTQGLLHIEKELGKIPHRISAQAYLEKFYASFGFVRVSENYLEDQIPHLEMLFTPYQN